MKEDTIYLFALPTAIGKTELLTNVTATIAVPTNRLKNEIEALDMGIDEYLYSGHWCFIEWPENIPNLIPEEHSTIKIEMLPDGKRHLNLS